MAVNFSVLTLNCWGIPVVSKNRAIRMQAIAKELLESSYDFVCLQEVWAQRDYMLIKKKTSEVLPYAQYFYSGVVGSGLCILSKHSIENSLYHRWPLNGYAHKVHHGDWFAGKGIGLCTFTANGLRINVYNAHMHAEYCLEGRNKYLAHRVSQAFDTAQFIYITSAYADVIICSGDFNTEPGDLCFKILEQHAGLVDSLVVASVVDNDGGMGTNDCVRNSYACSKLVQAHPKGKRIDHIFFRTSPGFDVRVSSYSLPFPKRVDGHNCSYSDHEAVSATLAVTPPSPEELNKPISASSGGRKKEELETMEEARSTVYNALSVVNGDRRTYSIASALLFLFLVASIGDFSQDGSLLFAIMMVLRGISVLLFVFTVFMATIWNSLERNALLATHEAMKVVLSYRPDGGNGDEKSC
ncbi:putative neutral sphingomyelinase [Ischnura elegans]|uniref:putative neutral sphingomyelinase n=1 Tax=Ischnura elegans TaxID=197161 RepID=UPI001ED8B88F|nr:putative neutral sphingomyelinase [Ischnura elegans]